MTFSHLHLLYKYIVDASYICSLVLSPEDTVPLEDMISVYTEFTVQGDGLASHQGSGISALSGHAQVLWTHRRVHTTYALTAGCECQRLPGGSGFYRDCRMSHFSLEMGMGSGD